MLMLSKKRSTILTALILLISLTSCKTIERHYIYPDFIHPEIDIIPTKNYVDGGFSAVNHEDENSDLVISGNDAKILAKYISDLKEWGSEGWIWIQDFYIKELDRLKDSITKD